MFVHSPPTNRAPLGETEGNAFADVFAYTGGGTSSFGNAGLEGKTYWNGASTWSAAGQIGQFWPLAGSDTISQLMADITYSDLDENMGMHFTMLDPDSVVYEESGVPTFTLYPSFSPLLINSAVQNDFTGLMDFDASFEDFADNYKAEYDETGGFSETYDSYLLQVAPSKTTSLILFDEDDFEIEFGASMINYSTGLIAYDYTGVYNSGSYCRLRFERQGSVEPDGGKCIVSVVSKTNSCTIIIDPAWASGTSETLSFFSKKGKLVKPIYVTFDGRVGAYYTPDTFGPYDAFTMIVEAEINIYAANNHGGHANVCRILMHPPIGNDTDLGSTTNYLYDWINFYGGWGYPLVSTLPDYMTWATSMEDATLDSGIWTLANASGNPTELKGFNIIPDSGNKTDIEDSPYLVTAINSQGLLNTVNLNVFQ